SGDHVDRAGATWAAPDAGDWSDRFAEEGPERDLGSRLAVVGIDGRRDALVSYAAIGLLTLVVLVWALASGDGPGSGAQGGSGTGTAGGTAGTRAPIGAAPARATAPVRGAAAA